MSYKCTIPEHLFVLTKRQRRACRAVGVSPSHVLTEAKERYVRNWTLSVANTWSDYCPQWSADYSYGEVIKGIFDLYGYRIDDAPRIIPSLLGCDEDGNPVENPGGPFTYGYSFAFGACNCFDCRHRRRDARRSLTVSANIQSALNFYGVRVGRPRFNGRERMREDAAEVTEITSYVDMSAKLGAARLVGVEVEYNREMNDEGEAAAEAWREVWPGASIHEDGSCGWEAVTPPMSGKYVSKCLTELMSDLTAYDAGCDANCGLHVHVDAKDVRWSDMFSFMSLYARLEPLLFVVAGQSRAKNRYCKPMRKRFREVLAESDWGRRKQMLLSYLILGDIHGDASDYIAKNGVHKKENGRYKAVNIMPWIAGRAFRRPDCTIEFRLHRGSHNAARVTAWARLCADIVDYATRHGESAIAALPRSPLRTLAIVSPDTKDFVLQCVKAYRRSTTAKRKSDEYDGAGRNIPTRAVRVLRRDGWDLDTTCIVAA